MKFSVDGKKIICIRIGDTESDNERGMVVAEFDAQVDKVPIHVDAALSSAELAQLEAFLADRRTIHRQSEDRIQLETLPELMISVCQILDSTEQIDENLYNRLMQANKQLDVALDTVYSKQQNGRTGLKVMEKSEELKEKLNIIKRSI